MHLFYLRVKVSHQGNELERSTSDLGAAGFVFFVLQL